MRSTTWSVRLTNVRPIVSAMLNMLKRYHERGTARAVGLVKPLSDPPPDQSLGVDDGVSFKAEKGDVPPIKLTNCYELKMLSRNKDEMKYSSCQK